MNKRPRPAVVLLGVSILMLITAVIAIAVAGSSMRGEIIDSVGDRIAAETPATTPLPTEASTLPAVRLAVPVRVRIPRIGITAPILATGLDKQKSMEIPEDIRKVGWYKLGVAPGSSRGSAVLVAHRDGRVQGHGAFYSIGSLNLGDRIFVTNSFGDHLKYKVVARERIPKAVLPTKELFAVDGAPRLTLISCGGYYNKSRGGYQDNIVVTAKPIPGTA